ncbi:MAG: DUF4407 domain-containing protein [Deltaproteobacteria bacterium]|nr:DUF4407 domain-containing protein [Deltaproteobacteria bacterium]
MRDSKPAHKPREASRLSRFLWSCAGADASVLVRCPYSDSVKFQGIGGIVLATAVLAFASGSYALYTVFEPKTGTALGRSADLPTALLAIGAGLVWGLVIFNIDRFIVSSTGKGDGTERITLTEFVQAVPRLVMAILLGICISAPLEIRILKPEIDAQLELEQNDYLAQLNALSEQRFLARKDELRTRLAQAIDRLDERVNYFEQRRGELNAQRRSLELEAEGRTRSGVAGRGPAWRDKKDTLDQMTAELDRDRASDAQKNAPLETDIKRWKQELASLDEAQNAALRSNLAQARHLDGLMKRIQISHEIGGFVPIFILLLLLAIETGPIFFKMMLRGGAYEYLIENEMRLAAARAGIEIDAQIYLPNTREEIRVDVFHQAESAFANMRRRMRQVSDTTHEAAPPSAPEGAAATNGHRGSVGRRP